MSSQPSRAFASAFASAMSVTAIQASRHEGLAKRMSAGATAIIAGLAISMTVAPAQAQAQNNNQVMRGAMDVVGAVVGGAIGSQIGGGSGKKAATVAGAAAGVWAAEALQQDSAPTQRGRAYISSGSSVGPVIAPGWGNTRVPGAEPRIAQSRVVERQMQLLSGTTQMSDERMSKLIAMEGMFLAARDGYARAIFASEQATDDAVLDPGARGVAQRQAATRAQQRQARTEFESARGTFVSAVEYMGSRGYDVHHFAPSHKMAQARVTANDMRRGDVVRVTRGARIVDEYAENDSVRGESYNR